MPRVCSKCARQGLSQAFAMWSECTLTVWLGCGHSGRRSWSWWPSSCCSSTSSGDNPLVTRTYIWKARLGAYGFETQAWRHVRLRCRGRVAARCVAAGAAVGRKICNAGETLWLACNMSAPTNSLEIGTSRLSWCHHRPGGHVGQLQALDENHNRSAPCFVMLLHSCGQMYTIHTGALQMTL